MALGDYILCSKCECKLIYDGHHEQRNWLEERFPAGALLCPNCLAAQESELARLRADNAELQASVERMRQRKAEKLAAKARAASPQMELTPAHPEYPPASPDGGPMGAEQPAAAGLDGAKAA